MSLNIRDARGRAMAQLDPMKPHLLPRVHRRVAVMAITLGVTFLLKT